MQVGRGGPGTGGGIKIVGGAPGGLVGTGHGKGSNCGVLLRGDGGWAVVRSWVTQLVLYNYFSNIKLLKIIYSISPAKRAEMPFRL